MTTHRSLLKTLTTPKQFTANDGIAFWQEKILLTLVSNAAEAQPAGGNIHISTRNIHLDTPLKGYDRVATGD